MGVLEPVAAPAFAHDRDRMTNLARWLIQSPMSDPAEYAATLAKLPDGIAEMSRIIQGVLVHSDWLPAYGLDHAGPAVSRETLAVADRLRRIFAIDPRPLDLPRPPVKRSPATCRDFALLLCSFLRAKNIPARLRCGFAAYLGGAWEDHWLCEYSNAPGEAWRLADPQIDDVLKALLPIEFTPPDVPGDMFLTAGQAWLGCRAGALDPDRFGHGATTGWRFIAVNVARDHYALNDRETSPWDDWRSAPATAPELTEDEGVWLDAVAASPEQGHVAMAPYWAAGRSSRAKH